MTTEHIQSPMPGVFYTRPDPDEATFVDEGDEVAEGDVVGLVGVMKNFHDITAPADGTITDVVAENEQEVDAGDDLLVLETN
ncbi:biotin carboxyl carrier domain-containing protein [Natronorubrum sp. JWXQ-INN-674]|uniref:Biotin carboxyl carrier protein of acetyl-CoA carboxylase n=1 Tax=Natronorubrum halalkaliphilum TaxID=2691917 RepID=A0A6B0VJF7_9EURY|nr:acetyl-CoA carboxylase [Natronorubrum halalkaliphilum]MXV61383.1 biotin carboxyl carrier domain-containing protein [Natronorubrum halalkaliphilum]